MRSTKAMELKKIFVRLARLNMAIEQARAEGLNKDIKQLTKKYKQAKQAYYYLLATIA